MRRIPNPAPAVKGVVVHRNGVKIPCNAGNPTGKGGGTRSKITGFTLAARRRMREALLAYSIPGGECFGLTLTVPWPDDWIQADENRACEEFRACFHRFGVAFRRKCSELGAIFRVELQQRKAPHIHAIIWAPARPAPRPSGAPVVPPGGDAAARWFGTLAALWFASVPDLHGGSLPGFAHHGVKADPIPDEGAMLRYLCDHATKAKQAQLGYQGKQWGFINRDALTKQPGDSLPFPDNPAGDKARALFARALRRLSAYHKTAPCVFGYHTLRNRRRCGVFYAHSAPVLRLYAWACALVGL